MFNTGDLGRWREDGSLEPHGRVDDQVKIKVCNGKKLKMM
jgi:non-ribosomal peptide synthetase component F